MNYINDSLRAKYIVDQEYDLAGNVSSCLQPGYFSTNESLDFFKKFDIKDKKVLTVCSSGDHAFMSLIHGANEVDTFASNPLQYYVMELKKGAIKVLDVEDYLKFFPVLQADIRVNYNINYYKQIRDVLPEDVKYFWDEIYSLTKPYIYLLNKFSYNLKFESDYTRHYEELKSKLNTSNISFKQGTLFSVPDMFNEEEYSLIILSNIFDHINMRNEKFTELDYYKFVKDNILPLLTEDGSVIFHYQFAFSKQIKQSSFPEAESIKCNLGDSIKVLRKK